MVLKNVSRRMIIKIAFVALVLVVTVINKYLVLPDSLDAETILMFLFGSVACIAVIVLKFSERPPMLLIVLLAAFGVLFTVNTTELLFNINLTGSGVGCTSPPSFGPRLRKDQVITGITYIPWVLFLLISTAKCLFVRRYWHK